MGDRDLAFLQEDQISGINISLIMYEIHPTHHHSTLPTLGNVRAEMPATPGHGGSKWIPNCTRKVSIERGFGETAKTRKIDVRNPRCFWGPVESPTCPRKFGKGSDFAEVELTSHPRSLRLERGRKGLHGVLSFKQLCRRRGYLRRSSAGYRLNHLPPARRVMQ